MCTRNCFHHFSTLSATFHLQSVTISRECGKSCWSAMLLLITNNRNDVTISSVSFNRILYVYVPVRVSNDFRHREKINYDSSMDLCRVHQRRKVRNEHKSTEREQCPFDSTYILLIPFTPSTIQSPALECTIIRIQPFLAGFAATNSAGWDEIKRLK